MSPDYRKVKSIRNVLRCYRVDRITAVLIYVVYEHTNFRG